MRTEEILILILLGLLIYLNYYYQKKIKELEAQKRVIIPIPVGGKTAYDFQWYNYNLENYLRR
jgi:hypothetical protein